MSSATCSASAVMSSRSAAMSCVAQVGVEENGVQQRGRLAQVLDQDGSAEAEPVGDRAGSRRAAQALEREGERGGVELARAAHRATDQQGPEPGLLRRIEPQAGDIDPERDERHPGLAYDQQIGAGQPGDVDTVLRPRAGGHRRGGAGPGAKCQPMPRAAAVTANAAPERIRGEIAPLVGREVGHAGHRVRREMPRGGFPHLSGGDLGEAGVLPVEQARRPPAPPRRRARWPDPPWTRAAGPSGLAPGCVRARGHRPSARSA